MKSTLKIQAKAVGRKKALIPDWAIPIPPDWHHDGRQPTLRDLITRVVLEEVERFKDRQDERRFMRVLTERQIEEGVEAGKIDSGERDLQQNVDLDPAVDAALAAFIDGLYFVFIDEVQYEELDQTIVVNEESQVTFIRLVALAGG
ncbi:MAG: hypothetical protein DWQ07_01360 [Chloroflexi bacterium]|nr:MAG: hypothetical protein DWQ07_01360 [Chloroflexota bacterium]MBL1193855.1 hypothetical protein [Chloroflexota bacterium]NOH11149.1 hypothetical protein [Chloroflexota bacterium]